MTGRLRITGRALADLIVPPPQVRPGKGGCLLLTTTARDYGV